MAQTKRELVKAALDCKPVDRVPVGFWHHFWQIRDTQMHWPITPPGWITWRDMIPFTNPGNRTL